MKAFGVLIALIMLSACAARTPTLDEQLKNVANSNGRPVDPISFDFGPIDHYNKCKAKPRRLLSEEEKCQLAILSSRCSKADDCMVSCISSPDGIRVIDGCYGTCPLGEPPLDFSSCESGG